MFLLKPTCQCYTNLSQTSTEVLKGGHLIESNVILSSKEQQLVFFHMLMLIALINKCFELLIELSLNETSKK